MHNDRITHAYTHMVYRFDMQWEIVSEMTVPRPFKGRAVLGALLTDTPLAKAAETFASRTATTTESTVSTATAAGDDDNDPASSSSSSLRRAAFAPSSSSPSRRTTFLTVLYDEGLVGTHLRVVRSSLSAHVRSRTHVRTHSLLFLFFSFNAHTFSHTHE
jgi:hypothetical protein